MIKYYVNLSGGTKDFEFQQVLDLLKEDQGYREEEGRRDVRVRQPDGSYREQGFLYLFDEKARAEEFADLVRNRTGNPSWRVFDVDIEPISKLIEEHRQFKDEPLILALYYDAGDDPREMHFLEVIENFGANSVNPDRELFEWTYDAPGPEGARRTWHHVMTSPPEFETALRENWRQAEQVRKAVATGRYEVLFMSEHGGIRSRESIHG